jgi:hypothetical protein
MQYDLGQKRVRINFKTTTKGVVTWDLTIERTEPGDNLEWKTVVDDAEEAVSYLKEKYGENVNGENNDNSN